MNIIEASQATHIADMFWRDNYDRNYKEKIMFAIQKQAESGARSLIWRVGMGKEIKSWLYSLGYTISIEAEHRETNNFKYIISWK